MRRAQRSAPWRALLLPALLLAGCASQPYPVAPQAPSAPPAPEAAADNGPLVGLAISGGGSRAATYAAAVMRELASLPIAADRGPATGSVLEAVRYVSGVSGGSLAAAYFGLRKPGRGVPMLAPDGLSAPYREFFRTFESAMRQDFERALIRGVLIERDSAVAAIANEWDQRFFRGATFADLAARERAGDSPTLIVNATSLDSGRRFAFTTLPQASFDVDPARGFLERLAAPADAAAARRALREAAGGDERAYLPVTFDELGASLGGFRIALAVAGSSAVPYLIGPLALSVDDGERPRLYHVADGGLTDNQGLESLMQLFARRQRAGGASALVIAIDASFPLLAVDANAHGGESRRQPDLDSAPRMTAIVEQAGKAYHSLVWSALVDAPDGQAGRAPAPGTIRIVELRHVDARETLAARPPPECGGGKARASTPDEIRARLSQIATRYEIGDRCDVALLRAAAQAVVAANAERIRGFFRR